VVFHIIRKRHSPNLPPQNGTDQALGLGKRARPMFSGNDNECFVAWSDAKIPETSKPQGDPVGRRILVVKESDRHTR
jgi:hypothetical protein